MISEKAKAVINRLDSDPKKGEAYTTGSGKGGFRNPIRSDVGMVLYNLVRTRRSWAAIEFGTADGLSGCFIGSALERGAIFDTIEFNGPTAENAQKNLDEALEGSGVQVKVHNGDALEMVKAIKESGRGIKYDVVFLDANKSDYLAYLEALKENALLAPQCLVIADNVLDRAEEVKPFMDYMEQFGNAVLAIGNAEGMPTAGLSFGIIP